MHVFFIPSWWPSKSCPHAGCFSVDLAREMAKTRKVSVSYWGQGENRVTRQTPLNLLCGLKLEPTMKQDSELAGLQTFYRRAPEWNVRYLKGGIAGVVEANLLNWFMAITRGRIDLIHAEASFPAGYVAMKLSEEFGVPYVIREHMCPFPFPSLEPVEHLIRQALEGAREVVAVSESLAKEIRAFGRTATVIPNMVTV